MERLIRIIRKMLLFDYLDIIILGFVCCRGLSAVRFTSRVLGFTTQCRLKFFLFGDS